MGDDTDVLMGRALFVLIVVIFLAVLWAPVVIWLWQAIFG